MGERHIPILRFGKAYTSLDTAQVTRLQGGEVAAKVSLANPGLIRRDLSQAGHPLRSYSTKDLVSLCRDAGRIFMEEALPLGEENLMGPDDFIQILSSTTGLPEVHCRTGMGKIHRVLTDMEAVLAGLSGGWSLDKLDQNWTPEVDCLGAVLPSNAPGVHTLWLPSIPLKTSVALKPGGTDPWTPYRIVQAFIKAGVPAEAFGYYPTHHEGAHALLMATQAGMIFGDASTVAPFQDHPTIEIHGPGRSKIVFGEDQAAHWKEHLPLMVESISGGGGRSCINASAIITPAFADEIATALANALSSIQPRGLKDPHAILSGFPAPETVAGIDSHLGSLLLAENAMDISAPFQPEGRSATHEGMHFLLPTVIRCEKPDHGLAQAEFPFPFVAVTEVPAEQLADSLKETLVCTVLTDDETLQEKIEASPEVKRVNTGAVPTNQLSWDRPLEGNLFQLLGTAKMPHGEDAS